MSSRALADQAAVQPVQPLVALLLVDLQVAGGMEGDGRAALAIAPDAQRDLLRHRPAGHEDRRLVAQDLGDPLLQAADPLALAVGVPPLVGAGRLGDRGQLLAQRGTARASRSGAARRPRWQP